MSGPSSHAAGVGSVAGSPRDAISGLKANVMVCARVRPLFGCGAEGTAQCVITASDRKRIVLEDPRHRELPKEFLFDHVFDSTVTTSTIFKTHVARGIDAAVLSHVPCTVFAHGASGSGKTFTMQEALPYRVVPRFAGPAAVAHPVDMPVVVLPDGNETSAQAVTGSDSLLRIDRGSIHRRRWLSAMFMLSEIDSPLGALDLISYDLFLPLILIFKGFDEAFCEIRDPIWGFGGPERLLLPALSIWKYLAVTVDRVMTTPTTPSTKPNTPEGIEGQPGGPVVSGNESGLIPMCVERIFKRVTSDMMVTMSVFEIYQEKVRDLLAQ
ncbi:Kinesin-like protein kif22, partial [Perkinsus olseni]